MSRGVSVLTLEQYKEFLALCAAAKAEGELLPVSEIGRKWGVNPLTLQSIRRRGIKKYDVMMRHDPP